MLRLNALSIAIAKAYSIVASGPSVSSITSATQAEGTSLVHTVTLSSAVSGSPQTYAFSIGGGTATSGTDYNATPTFSASVTLSGGTLTVPVGVSSFTITVSTTNDTVYEGTETYTVSVGSMSNTGTLTDNDSAPTVTGVSSASATEASSIVHTVTVTGTAQAAQTFAISLSGGTATGGGTDYTSTLTNGAFSAGVTISGGNISVPSGVTSFTVTVPTTADVLEEGNETYTLTIGGASGTGTIVDDDAPSPAFTVTMTALGNASGTVTTNAYINAASGSTLTLSVDESVASGVAPLAVFFDATATTSTQTTRPFHDVGYWWDFGDTSAGTWSNGTGANTSRNSAYGPVTAHVFETAGTYTVTLTAHDGVSTTTTTKTITVTAADTEWAGTKTICYSTNTDFTGAPSGCVQVANVTNLATSIAANIGASGNTRHLLHKGQTFSLSGSIAINKGGPSMVGAFGTGAKPIILATTSAAIFNLSSSSTPTGVSDWRFVGLTLDGGSLAAGFVGAGSCSKMTILDCDEQNIQYGLLLSGPVLDALNSTPYTHALWDQFSFVNSTVYNLIAGSGPNGIYGSCKRIAVLGSSIDNNGGGEHGIRMQYCDRGVFNNNTIQGIPSGKLNLTIRGVVWAGTNTTPAGSYSEKIVVSDNKLNGGVSVLMMSLQSENQSYDERGRNMIVERNWFNGSSSTQNFLTVAQTDVTIRNNVGYAPSNNGGSFVTFKDEDVNAVAVPTRGHVYNNTFYHASTGSNYFALVYAQSNNSTLSGCTFENKNNIIYAPSASAVNVVGNTSSATITSSNNTTNVATSPLLATNPPTAIAHFTPSGSSYAQGGGTNVKNWKDLYSTTTQATPDMGAVVIA